MLILGIDPGLVNTGWSVIEFNKKNLSEIVDCGLIVTNSSNNISYRLLKVFDSLHDKLDKYDLESGAIEKTLVNKNAISSMDLSMSRSVALLYFAQRSLNYVQYMPTFVKKSITGNGKADKDQLREMLSNYLKCKWKEKISKISHHEVDSISIAICHGFASNNALFV